MFDNYNISLLHVNDGPQQLAPLKVKMTQIIGMLVRQFNSSNHTIIVDAEFLVLACASNHHHLDLRPRLVYRPGPPAPAVDMCNVDAR